MKKFLLTLAFVLCSCMSAFSQATSLTVDCQNPGWLSSKIGYGDQQTVENLKVTGYINGTDLQFIIDLNTKRSLVGAIDLEHANIVSGGTLDNYPKTVEHDNELPYNVFGGNRYVRKLILPQTLVQNHNSIIGGSGDSLIWTNPLRYINVGSNFNYTYIPEGVEELKGIPNNVKINFPNSLKEANVGRINGLTIYSMIENPESVSCQYELYYNIGGYSPSRTYWVAIYNSTFYIPKGTMEKYLRSDFATMDNYRVQNGNYQRIPNGNVFIEYYDIDSTVITSPLNLYVGDVVPMEVKVYPNDSLVSWIDYVSLNAEVANVQPGGNLVANGYGQTEIYATPHVFIDGLETKTDTCIVNVVAHTEGIAMPSTMKVYIGEEKNLDAATLPLDITDNKISFESSNSSIASVDRYGVIHGKNEGVCTITATTEDGGFTATCEVTVVPPVPVAGIALNNSSLQFDYIGETCLLEATILPEDAANKKVKWTSSNESVCIVSNGMVVAVGMGTSVVIATTEDGGFMAVCIVTVTSATGISSAEQNDGMMFQIYDINGLKQKQLQKGINIIQFKDGSRKKVLIK